MEAERARVQAELDARPRVVRLTEARCTRCHGVEPYSAQRHTWIGWQWVVLRMQWLNDAVLEPGERAQIVDHLAGTYPAAGAGAWTEWGTAVALALLALALPVARFLRWRRGAL
jgi:hypothetical protein